MNKKITAIILLLLIFYTTLLAEQRKGDLEMRKKIVSKYKDLSKDFTCPEINALELKKAVNSGKAVLIDVRDQAEISVSRIPGAITVKEFTKNKSKYKNKMIVAYCTIGYRSGVFASKHKDLKILNLLGGVLMWSHTGGKFVNAKGATKDVHVYSKEWNFLNSNYKAVTE